MKRDEAILYRFMDNPTKCYHAAEELAMKKLKDTLDKEGIDSLDVELSISEYGAECEKYAFKAGFKEGLKIIIEAIKEE